ncbi:MAG TPA: ABC transporter permease, partial [Sinorhizobium sp.]|nr:ABC transporter permease [Sinorhizobium sp.]
MPSLANIFWLGTKELRSLSKDLMMILFIIWSFGFSIYTQATGSGETINNAAIAIVDEDHSQLSRSIAGLFYPPYFQTVDEIGPQDIDSSMDKGLYTVVLVIPPGFERDTKASRSAQLQINVDATDSQQASLASAYVQSMAFSDIARYVSGAAQSVETMPDLVIRRAFNPNGTQAWFRSVISLADQLSMLMIILTGAALLREREHGTIEHLLVMPLNALEIALGKLWANGSVIIGAFICSLLFVVEGVLDVPIAGSRGLIVFSSLVYVFAAAAIGILLGTMA